jgi:deoxyadenosine/deoxycytidine kinase
MAFVVFVEGNIGGGKSSLLSRLEVTRFPFKHVVLREPVEQWEMLRDDETDENILERFYRDKARNGFMFQVYALSTRAYQLRKTILENPDRVIFVERSLQADREVFATEALEAGHMDAMCGKVYACLSDILNDVMPSATCLCVYLRTSPDVCMERVKVRKRSGEESIDVAYLQKIHDRHETWMRRHVYPVHTIDGDTDVSDVNEWASMVQGLSSLLSSRLKNGRPTVLGGKDGPASVKDGQGDNDQADA